jgi:maltose/moltooligosaccharide transporter
MGMFNLFVVIPQILAAATMGLMLNKWLNGHTINMMVLGGVSMLIAGVLMMFVKDSGREAQ